MGTPGRAVMEFHQPDTPRAKAFDVYTALREPGIFTPHQFVIEDQLAERFLILDVLATGQSLLPESVRGYSGKAFLERCLTRLRAFPIRQHENITIVVYNRMRDPQLFTAKIYGEHTLP